MNIVKEIITNRLIRPSLKLSLFYGFATILLAAFIVTWDKNTMKIESLYVFIIKIIPFFLALLSIACFPDVKEKKAVSVGLVLAIFTVIWCLFIPRSFYLFHQSQWEKFYLLTQMFVPFIILSLLFSYKLGGGKTKETLVIGSSCFIFLLSGIEDFCYFAINGYAIPDQWTWAEHMKIRLGHVPSKYQAYMFIGVHFLIIMAIIFLSYSQYSPFRRDKNKTK